jgi:hypothetical protein
VKLLTVTLRGVRKAFMVWLIQFLRDLLEVVGLIESNIIRILELVLLILLAVEIVLAHLPAG